MVTQDQKLPSDLPGMPRTKRWIFSDRPVGLGDDKLWEGGIIREQVNDIAYRIAAPLLSDSGVSSMASLTFAIHGRWGSGKTSFITMVIEQARRSLEREEIPRDYLLECRYRAAAFEGMGESARSTLAMRVLLTLAGGENEKLEAIRLFSRYVENTDPTALIEELQRDDLKVYDRITMLNEHLDSIARRLSSHVGFEDLIKAELSGEADSGALKAMVIVIDDLDRCSPAFVHSVLETIQQWSGVEKLFFILAVDRDVLNDAIAQRTESYGLKPNPDVALEKYIQHSIEIPELTHDQIGQFVGEMLGEYDDAVAQALKLHSNILAHGISVRTPRGVKRCLNTIRPALSDAFAATDGPTASEKEQRLAIKKRMLEYTWRSFYRDYYQRAEGKQNQFSNAIAAIERASVIYAQEEDLEQLNFALNRIRGRLNVTSKEVPTDTMFARFLAIKPWFFLTDEMLKSSVQATLAGIVPAEEPESRIDTSDLLSRTTPVQQLEGYYRDARQAQATGDVETVLNCMLGALQLVEEHGLEVFTPDEVADFGNLALYAERLVSTAKSPDIQKIALNLFQNAYRLNPDHLNNLLNYADFILDASFPRLSGLYDFCDQLLGDDEERFAKQGFLGRWLSERAKFAYQVKDAEPGWETYIQRLVELLEDEAEEDIFFRITAFYNSVGSGTDMSLLQKAARIQIPRLSGQKQNHALLVYADALDKGTNDSKDPSIREALEVYKFVTRPIEEGGIRDTYERKYRGNALHNYGVTLHRVGYLEEAGRRWYQAYQILGTDLNLVRAYSAYLREYCNRPDAAAKVERGELLEGPILATEDSKPVPEHFVEGGIHRLFDI